MILSCYLIFVFTLTTLSAEEHFPNITCRTEIQTFYYLLKNLIPNLALFADDDPTHGNNVNHQSNKEVLPVGYSTERNFLSSLISVGFSEKFRALKEKISRKENVRIIAFGGSITVGAAAGRDVTPWPELLQIFSHAMGYESIFVKNNALRAHGTSIFIDKIPFFKSTPGHPILDADIVIYETAANDVMGLVHESLHGQRFGIKATDTIAQEVEIVVRQFLSLPKRPIVIFLEASSRHQWLPSAAVFSHQQVALQYGIPQLSMLHMFSGGELSETLRSWAERYYRADGCHINAFGQKLVAVALFHFLDLLFCDKWGNLDTMDRTSFRTIDDPPFLSSAEYSRMYETGKPVFISPFNYKDYLAMPTAFEDSFDRRHYIASRSNDTGASVIFRIEKQNVHFGLVVVEYMGSYTRMGSFAVSLYDKWEPPPESSGVSRECAAHFPSQRPIATSKVDACWTTKVTISVTAQVFFNATGADLYLCIEVVPASPPRPSNEVWLPGVVIF